MRDILDLPLLSEGDLFFDYMNDKLQNRLDTVQPPKARLVAKDEEIEDISVYSEPSEQAIRELPKKKKKKNEEIDSATVSVYEIEDELQETPSLSVHEVETEKPDDQKPNVDRPLTAAEKEQPEIVKIGTTIPKKRFKALKSMKSKKITKEGFRIIPFKNSLKVVKRKKSTADIKNFINKFFKNSTDNKKLSLPKFKQKSEEMAPLKVGINRIRTTSKIKPAILSNIQRFCSGFY